MNDQSTALTAEPFAQATENTVNSLTIPMNRRLLFHSAVEVRAGDQIIYRFIYSFVPQEDENRNRKTAILTAHFIGADRKVLPPPDKAFRHSDRYGHFMYVGVPEGSKAGVIGEWDGKLSVPRGATHAVLCLLPFSNPTVRLAHAAVEVGPVAT